MNRLEQSRGWKFTFPFEIVYLAADHSTHGAGSYGELFDDPSLRFRLAIELRKHLKRESEQCVAGQDRDRLAEHFMAGGAAATHVVVIECRQIVVDQGISMYQLERAGGGLDSAGRIGDGLCGGYAKDGTDALSAGEQAVAHRLVDGFGRRGFEGDQTLKGFLNPQLLFANVTDQRHALSGWNGSAWILFPLRTSTSMRVSASSNCLRHVS